MKKQGAAALIVAAVIALAGCSAAGDADAGTGATKAPKGAKESVERVAVPDVVGMTLDEATASLTGAGFTVETIGEVGEVESQTPSAGVEVDPGTAVTVTVVDRAAEEAAAAEAAAAEAARVGTLSQQNAYAKAQSYLDMTAFSRSGLAEQLQFEGFPAEDAEFGIARLEAEGAVDWNAQAAAKAASYLEMMAFSRSSLVEQLQFEGFTPEQAEYGVSTTGL